MRERQLMMEFRCFGIYDNPGGPRCSGAMNLIEFIFFGVEPPSGVFRSQPLSEIILDAGKEENRAAVFACDRHLSMARNYCERYAVNWSTTVTFEVYACQTCKGNGLGEVRVCESDDGELFMLDECLTCRGRACDV